jgi:guanyl-specific ribonuclease Sa
MRWGIVLVTSGVALIVCTLTSCDTPVGQGAAWGAATGRSSAARRLAVFAVRQLALPQEPQQAL